MKLLAAVLLSFAVIGAAEARELYATSVTRVTNARVLKNSANQDRLGNVEIQNVMSQHNRAESLSSNVQKKLDGARCKNCF
jgi:hypothetical protein